MEPLNDARTQKVKNIIDQYDKINNIILDACEELGMQVCIAVHVRDSLNRSKEYPDWYWMHLVARSSTEYHKAVFCTMVNHYFSRIWWFDADNSGDEE